MTLMRCQHYWWWKWMPDDGCDRKLARRNQAQPNLQSDATTRLLSQLQQCNMNETKMIMWREKKQMPVEYAPCFGGLGCHVTQQTGKITFTLQHRIETKLAAEKNTTFDIKSVNFSLTALVLSRYMLNLVFMFVLLLTSLLRLIQLIHSLSMYSRFRHSMFSFINIDSKCCSLEILMWQNASNRKVEYKKLKKKKERTAPKTAL